MMVNTGYLSESACYQTRFVLGEWATLVYAAKDPFRRDGIFVVRVRDPLEDVETLHVVDFAVHCCRPVVRVGRAKRLATRPRVRSRRRRLEYGL